MTYTSGIINYEDMLAYVLDIPGASDILIKQNLAFSGRQFCIDTELYEEELEPIDIASGTSSYNLESLLPTNTSIIRIKGLKYGVYATDEDTTDYDASYYSLENETTIKFNTAPIESITDGMVVTVILRPDIGNTGLSQWFFDRYSEGIIAYAKYKILRIPRKPWTDLDRSREYLKIYTEYLVKYRREKWTQGKEADIHLTHNKWSF